MLLLVPDPWTLKRCMSMQNCAVVSMVPMPAELLEGVVGMKPGQRRQLKAYREPRTGQWWVVAVQMFELLQWHLPEVMSIPSSLCPTPPSPALSPPVLTQDACIYAEAWPCMIPNSDMCCVIIWDAFKCTDAWPCMMLNSDMCCVSSWV